ncbi:hypothetical protein RB598_004404 [Gaeumannomyces tritici]
MPDAQIAGGHKANTKNPNTSQESKEHSKQVLEKEFNGGNGMWWFHQNDQIRRTETETTADMFGIYSVPKTGDSDEGKNPCNVAGG